MIYFTIFQNVGYYHSLFISDPPALFASGETENGKLGLPVDIGEYVFKMTQVKLPDSEEPVSVSAGGNHSFVTTKLGHVYAMGSGTHGQLGIGTSVSSESFHSPVVIKSFADSGIFVKYASAGESHSGFVTDDGKIFVCGNALHCRLGVDVSGNAYFPRLANLVEENHKDNQIKSSFYVSSVACGGCHTVCIASKSSQPLGDSTNFGTTTSLFSVSTARQGRRARKNAAAQSLNLALTTQNIHATPPPATAPAEVAKSTSFLPNIVPNTQTIASTVHDSSIAPNTTLPTASIATTSALDQTTPTMAMAAQLQETNAEQPPLQTSEAIIPLSAAQAQETVNKEVVDDVSKTNIPSDDTANSGDVDDKPTATTTTTSPPPKKSGFSLPLICGKKTPAPSKENNETKTLENATTDLESKKEDPDPPEVFSDEANDNNDKKEEENDADKPKEEGVTKENSSSAKTCSVL